MDAGRGREKVVGRRGEWEQGWLCKMRKECFKKIFIKKRKKIEKQDNLSLKSWIEIIQVKAGHS